VDFGWLLISEAVVGAAFDVVVFGEVSLDHSGVAAVAAAVQGATFGDLFDGGQNCDC
jgi:hypothetical protein